MSNDELQRLSDVADGLQRRGIRRIHVLAWRDLDDPDSGGSEVHADEFMRRWSTAGFTVLQRTSAAVGRPSLDRRNGYDIVRRGNRYSVFPRVIAAETFRRMGTYDAMVEIWNGVPWFAPLWSRRPTITIVHHVHGPMWGQVLPAPLDALGRALESRLAPPFYRRALTVTPSESTREELLELGFRAGRVVAVPNGTDPRFSRGGVKTDHPSLVAVARLAPVKRLHLLIDAAARARLEAPGLTLTIVGDGPEREALIEHVRRLNAARWVNFAGRVDHDDLVDLYRRSWLVVSASLAEGWGLSLTEGAGCGTPAVVTDIRGHRSSVIDGVTGLLVEPSDLGAAIAKVVNDHELRARLAEAAHARARKLSWDATALGILSALERETR